MTRREKSRINKAKFRAKRKGGVRKSRKSSRGRKSSRKSSRGRKSSRRRPAGKKYEHLFEQWRTKPTRAKRAKAKRSGRRRHGLVAGGGSMLPVEKDEYLDTLDTDSVLRGARAAGVDISTASATQIMAGYVRGGGELSSEARRVFTRWVRRQGDNAYS